MTPRNPRLTPKARQMRKAPTPAEAVMWGLLRRSSLGVRFRRQQSIGPFVVDFVAPLHGLVIELDGAGHYDPFNDSDSGRDTYLKAHGFRVLRAENRAVFVQPDDLLDEIRRLVADPRAEPAYFGKPL